MEEKWKAVKDEKWSGMEGEMSKAIAMDLRINLIEILNFIVMMCTVPIICVGIWLFKNNCYDWFLCSLVAFIIFLGVTFLPVAFLSCWKKPGDMAWFFTYTALLIVILLVIVALVFLVAAPSGGHSVPGAAYKDYRLSGFSTCLKHYVTNPENWNIIRNRIEGYRVCENLNDKFNKYNYSAQRFYASHISPIESGCCKPPAVCGYYFINPILWINPTNISADPDCSRWSSSDTYTLCYDCDSCKAGAIVNLRNIWLKANAVLTVVLLVLICIHLIACWAYTNAKTEEDLCLRYDHKQGWV